MPKTGNDATPKLTLVNAAPSLPQAKGVNLQLFRDVAEAFGVLEEFDRRVAARRGGLPTSREVTHRRPAPRRPTLRLIQGGAA